MAYPSVNVYDIENPFTVNANKNEVFFQVSLDHFCTELNIDDIEPACFWMTPTEARLLADRLIDEAEIAEELAKDNE